VLKALAHPLRFRILVALNEGPASPKELADRFGERLQNVSYHVSMLRRLDCIELVSETPRRGALEHHYRATVEPFFSAEDWGNLPPEARQGETAEGIRGIVRDMSRAADGGFADPRALQSSATFTVDSQAMDEIGDLLQATLRKAQRIADQSAKRAGSNGKGTRRAEVVVALFEPATDDK
jgi:DNA-binding transcriptional ArsR family regulator